MAPPAYSSRSDRSNINPQSTRSPASDISHRAASNAATQRPVIRHYETTPASSCSFNDGDSDDGTRLRSWGSVETYASTVPSEDDLSGKPENDIPSKKVQFFPSDAIATTPPIFAELFQPGRKILIHHDDSTSDGNMNLRLDTEIATLKGRRRKMTLFHLKMTDLRDRQFSLRRYCRESGREVCNSKRKFTRQSAPKLVTIPLLQRSLSSALYNLGIKSNIIHARPAKVVNDSTDYFDNFEGTDFDLSENQPLVVPTNTIRLEFANYAQVQVDIHGSKRSKLYEYEYWGTSYHWSREIRRDGHLREVSYHLFKSLSGKAIAHIVAEKMSRRQAAAEEDKGGWIPPCSLVITDTSAFSTDLADVIVATGLLALIDDSINRRWHSKGGVSMTIPGKNTPNYIEPGRLIDELFNRRGYTANQR
jgi:hypothetical protein